jgi:hypothetical protein
MSCSHMNSGSLSFLVNRGTSDEVHFENLLDQLMISVPVALCKGSHRATSSLVARLLSSREF